MKKDALIFIHHIIECVPLVQKYVNHKTKVALGSPIKRIYKILVVPLSLGIVSDKKHLGFLIVTRVLKEV